MPTAPYLLLFLASTAFLGALLLYKGIHPRRRGSARYCKRCKYSLQGLTSPRCPECGTVLTAKNTTLGERTRRPGLIATGSILFLASTTSLACSLWIQAQKIEWYTYAPTWWILHDLRSATVPVASRALTEIERRWNQLAPDQRHDCLDICLDDQITPRPIATIELLGESVDAHILSSAQRARFFSHAIFDITSAVRPRAMPGKPVPFGLQLNTIARASTFSGFTRVTAIRIDGQPALNVEAYNSIWRGEPLDEVGGQFAAPSTLGHHSVEITVECRLYYKVLVVDGQIVTEGLVVPIDHPVPKDKAMFTKIFLLKHPLEVVENDVELIRNPALAEVIRSKTSVDIHDSDTKGDRQVLTRVNMINLDIPWAIDAEAIVDGKIYPLGNCMHLPTEMGNMTYSLGVEALPANITKVTVILRTNPERARETGYAFETWDGELVFRDVPIEKWR